MSLQVIQGQNVPHSITNIHTAFIYHMSFKMDSHFILSYDRPIQLFFVCFSSLALSCITSSLRVLGDYEIAWSSIFCNRPFLISFSYLTLIYIRFSHFRLAELYHLNNDCVLLSTAVFLPLMIIHPKICSGLFVILLADLSKTFDSKQKPPRSCSQGVS